MKCTADDGLHVLGYTLQQSAGGDVPHLEESVRTHCYDLVRVLQELAIPYPLRVAHQGLGMLETLDRIDVVDFYGSVRATSGESPNVISELRIVVRQSTSQDVV